MRYFDLHSFDERRDCDLASERGQSLVEFALIFPVMFLLIVNVINFGAFMEGWIAISNAARAGAQYMSTGGATVYGPSTPSSTQVSTLIANDISSLPNASSLVVKWCTNNNGTISGSYSTCPARSRGAHLHAGTDRCHLYLRAYRSALVNSRLKYLRDNSSDHHPSSGVHEDNELMAGPRVSCPRARRGGVLIEFSFIALLLWMVLFTMFEFDRMSLVTAALADSTRAGLRYAIVHGSDDPVATSAIQTVVQNFAGTGILNVANLTITVTYSACATDPGDGCSLSPYTSPGANVKIKTTYAYDPFTTYFPLSVTLGSTSQGVIVF